MKKVLLYTVTVCSFSSLCIMGKVNEQLSLENIFQQCNQAEVKLNVSESLLTLRKRLEDDYSESKFIDTIKDAFKQLELQDLEQECAQDRFKCTFIQALFTIRQLQDQACSGNDTFEQVKAAIEQQFGALREIPNDDSDQAKMLQYVSDIFKQAVAAIAEATRKNSLPAVHASMFKKGVDAQANRLKVITLFEEFFS